MKPDRLPTWRTLVLGLLSTLLAALLPGCGPGVGGTGTGADAGPLDDFGAITASVCAPGSGLQPACSATWFLDSPTAPRISARLADDVIELRAPCLTLQFSGRWGQLPGEPPRFFGSVRVGDTSTPATLTASATGKGALLVELRDLQGRVLLGALVLQPAAAAPDLAPGGC